MSASPEITSAEMVPIRSLRPADSPRLSGEDAEHIAALAQLEDALPPIVVHRRTMRVIDGMHRLRAALLRGAAEIDVQFFDGDEDAAFVLAVSANVAHGLPLTRADRAAAAARILASHPVWSDRAIGARTGLAAATVARIRRRSGASSREPDARVGRDGRIRPLNQAAGRRVASALMTEHPDASLREIACSAGVSVATALDVRRRLGRGDDPVRPQARKARNKQESQAHPEGQEEARGPRPRLAAGVCREPAVILQKMRRDPSLRYSEKGRQFLASLSEQALGLEQWRQSLDRVPPHVLGVMAEFARSCSSTWACLAEDAERRARDGLRAPRSSPGAVAGRASPAGAAPGPGRARRPASGGRRQAGLGSSFSTCRTSPEPGNPGPSL